MASSNPEIILKKLDQQLNDRIELTLIGRAALILGYEPPIVGADASQTFDVDLVVPSDQEQALDQNEQLWIIGLAQPAAAQSTVPLFDSGGSLVIGGDKSPYPYPANIAPPTGQQTFYISLGTGNQSGSPWGGGNEVTSLNLSLWAYSATGSAVPVTVGLYSGTDNGTGLSGLTALSGVSAPFGENINNTLGGNYTNSATEFSFSLTGGAQTTDPIPANTDLIVAITVTAGSPLDLAIGAPLGGSPNYTFSNAFTGSTGLDGNTYLYAGGNGNTSSFIQQNTNLLPFVDLTASITPLPELPPVTYLLLSLPLVLGVLMMRRRARA